ncbi:glycosyltransferase [Xanthocytophaga flava]|uniref:glycosyltransferase n=1 Tax=Xanthocytophaga flava TaxID=3048013 RepID=UPI0028D3F37C|nr:glycosyltransferase [Xanthocytophaga flavus]MDJ1471636.1 glycosyltransferase [Xanthocytophaga flavus]
MELAPIILFVYNRPWHTQQTLIALAQNHLASESILYIYADGPKNDASPEVLEKIKETRNVIRQQQWCKEVHIVESEENKGLADSVIQGVTETVNKYGKVIVLEDDLITSPFFLHYMNEGLEMYQSVSNVYAINGYMFSVDTAEIDTFLCPLATSSWGWGTWTEKWKAFDRDTTYKSIIQKNPLIRQRFNFADYDYAAMLDNTNSWAIRWYYSVFMRNGLGLFPSKSLVKNIGVDGSGVHSDIETDETFPQELFLEKIPLIYKDSINIYFYDKLLERFLDNKRNVEEEETAKSGDKVDNNIFKSLMKKIVGSFL